MRNTGLKIYFDGGARPNPGMIETGIMVRGIFHHSQGLGPGDSNMAEWLALLRALQLAAKHGERNVILIGDSALIINQAKGLWPCRNSALQGYYAEFVGLAGNFDRIRLRHVGRSHNLAGIALDNLRHGSKSIMLAPQIAYTPCQGS